MENRLFLSMRWAPLEKGGAGDTKESKERVENFVRSFLQVCERNDSTHILFTPSTSLGDGIFFYLLSQHDYLFAGGEQRKTSSVCIVIDRSFDLLVCEL